MVGVIVGSRVGSMVGAMVGAIVGAVVGVSVGAVVGTTVGVTFGSMVGVMVGTSVGAVVTLISTERPPMVKSCWEELIVLNVSPICGPNNMSPAIIVRPTSTTTSVYSTNPWPVSCLDGVGDMIKISFQFYNSVGEEPMVDPGILTIPRE
jgi:hypothetical protein